MGQLEDYIIQSKQKGYSLSQIRETLLKAGYSRSNIINAFKQFEKQNSQTLNVQHKFVLFSGLIIFMIIFWVIYYFFVFSQSVFISFELKSLQSDFFSGDTIVFERSLTTSINKKIDVVINYQLFDSVAEKSILQKKENFFLVKQNTAKVYIPTANNIKSGKYKLISTIVYDNKEQQKQFEIFIKEAQKTLIETPKNISFESKPEVVLDCPKGCDDFNLCTQDTCQNSNCVFTPKIPCCGNGKCEQGESGLECVQDCAAKIESPADIEQKAKNAVLTDPSIAITLCQSIPQALSADQCIYKITLQINNSQSCSSIQEVSTRDSCYMEFARNNDFTGCDNVQNSFLQTSCYSLEMLKTQQDQINLLQKNTTISY